MNRLRLKSVLITVMLVFVAFSAFAETPAPFDKAKEMALTGKLNQNGTYVLVLKDEYFFGYIPSITTIGIGIILGEEAQAIEYNENTGKFSFYVESEGMAFRREITREQAIEAAFKIFREMVGEKLI